MTEKYSSLIILNTIQDTIDLYNIVKNSKTDFDVHLLNTRFIPDDRKFRIKLAKKKLINNEKIILITTQLIEAGVDIDFPVVYRDICSLPSIVQSSGRCNRNNKYREKGRVIIFTLEKNGKNRSELIYRGKDKLFLDYVGKSIKNSNTTEPELLNKQMNFFKYVNDNTIFGIHYSSNKEIDLIDKIKNVEFEETGKFKLIDERIYGEEYSYYVPKNRNDLKFEDLEQLVNKLKLLEYSDFENRKICKIKIEEKIKSMSGRITQVRLKINEVPPPASGVKYYGIQKLESDYYDENTGINVTSDNQII